MMKRPSWMTGSRTWLCMAAVATLLSACGGGGGSEAATPQAVAKATALYFTDDFSAEHQAVWISVTRVTAVGPTGETVLASFEPARMINVPQLKQAGDLFALTPVPADATALRVHVASAARVQRLDGSSLDVTLAAPLGYLEVRLEGWKRDSGVLALDFDLPRFVLTGTTLTPATRLASDSDFASWNHRSAEVKGTVTAITATSLTVLTRDHGSRQFLRDSNTLYVSPRGATWAPAVGDAIEIYGLVSGQGGDGLQFTARTVKDKASPAAAGLTEVEGRISAVNGNSVTMSVTKSKSGAATGMVTFDISAASFKRGTAASLTPGVFVEAYLQQAGTNWLATMMEVKGAPKTDDPRSQGYQEQYAELKGHVISVSGDAIVLRVLKAKRVAGVAVGADVAINLAGAYFEKGSMSCVVGGTPLEVKGGVDAAGAFVPVRVEVETPCASAAPLGGVNPGSPPVATGPMSVDVKGAITAVRPGEFDLSVYRIEYAAGSLTSMTVRHSSATYFDRLTPAMLAVGGFVEVKGSLSGTTLEASKIEVD